MGKANDHFEEFLKIKKGFKFSPAASQIGAIRAGITPDQMDLIDLCMFDAIQEYTHFEGCEKKQFAGKTYFRISWQIIRKRLPYAGIKSRSAIKSRMAKIVSAGLLERHPNNVKTGESYFAFGRKYTIFINEQPVRETGRVEQPEHPEPVREKSTPSCKRDGTRPANETGPVRETGRNEYTLTDSTLYDSSLSTREAENGNSVNGSSSLIDNHFEKEKKVAPKKEKDAGQAISLAARACDAVTGYLEDHPGQKEMMMHTAGFRGTQEQFETELRRWVLHKAGDAAFLSNPIAYIHKLPYWLSGAKIQNNGKNGRSKNGSKKGSIQQYQTRYGTGEGW